MAVHEAGCIRTSQGLEFDYTGVIIGDGYAFQINYDESKKPSFKSDRY